MARGNQLYTGLNGWLSPQGRFFPCLPREHDKLAAQLAARFYDSDCGTRTLEQENWIRVCNGFFRWAEDYEPSHVQYEAACEMVPNALSDIEHQSILVSIMRMERNLAGDT